MRTCGSCLRHFPTWRDRLMDRLHWLLLLIVGISLGYLLREGVFVQRENSALWTLVNTYVKRVETDKLVDANTALRAKGRQVVERKRGE